MPTVATTTSTIRLGAIGMGLRLQGVLRHLLKQNSRIRLNSVFDPFEPYVEAGEELAGGGVIRRDDWRAVVTDPDIDWVMIGSPNCFHEEQTIAALEAGKHVFCEKPLAIDLDSCLRVADAVRNAPGRFVFGLVLRYSPHYQAMRHLLAEGKIGKLISFEFNETLRIGHGGYIFGNWRRDASIAGSHILEKTCHDLDLANWMADSLPVRVASFGGRQYFVPKHAYLKDLAGTMPDGQSRFQAWPDPHSVDPFSAGATIFDHQVVILEYANGVKATFHTNCAAGLPERRFYLCGTEGSLRGEVYTGDMVLQRIDQDQPEACSSGSFGGHGGGDEVMAQQMAATMLDDQPPLAGLREALQSATVAFAIDKAAETGAVVDLRPMWSRCGIDPNQP
ncbi:Gfo/Idh/MocA family protein [Phycisphaerales bacterium AB-hyl4]|uniref:Gfo/Idh/MocA family protein n=1 Tax=Natronomicrosphaera hydrolytica TaxID=3242702 RepID=A0ABV4U812_9BACT